MTFSSFIQKLPLIRYLYHGFFLFYPIVTSYPLLIPWPFPSFIQKLLLIRCFCHGLFLFFSQKSLLNPILLPWPFPLFPEVAPYPILMPWPFPLLSRSHSLSDTYAMTFSSFIQKSFLIRYLCHDFFLFFPRGYFLSASYVFNSAPLYFPIWKN